MLRRRISLLLFLIVALVSTSLSAVLAAPRHAPASDVTDIFVQALEGTGGICLQDNFGFVWNLHVAGQQSGYLILSGIVETDCGPYQVHGTYNFATGSFAITATNPNAPPGCAKSFTYHGKYNTGTQSGSGVWTNDIGGSGTFTIGPCSNAPAVNGSDRKPTGQ
jgi:hypothetical protein